jgi:hypothetical protein
MEWKRKDHHKKERVPFYLKESHPDPSKIEAKNMVMKLPESLDRPSAEIMSIMVDNLFKK